MLLHFAAFILVCDYVCQVIMRLKRSVALPQHFCFGGGKAVKFFKHSRKVQRFCKAARLGNLPHGVVTVTVANAA